jgi:hypothetical protein
MPLLHDSSSSYRRRLTSYGIHNLPGSVPLASGGALRPDSGPYAGSSGLRLASLQLIPWGLLVARLWTASFLDRAESSLYMPPSLRGRLSENSCHVVKVHHDVFDSLSGGLI